jgi:hypothetical protein
VCVSWIELAEDRGQLWAVGNTVLNRLVPQRRGIFYWLLKKDWPMELTFCRSV